MKSDHNDCESFSFVIDGESPSNDCHLHDVTHCIVGLLADCIFEGTWQF